MRTRLAAAAFAAALAGAGAAWLALRSRIEADPAVAAVLAPLVGWAYLGSGLVAWRQRPGNRLGPIMAFVGAAWLATFLADAPGSLPFTVGTALENVYLVGFVALVLAFPSGRLQRRADRALVAAAALLATGVELVWLSFAPATAVICGDCPPNALLLVRDERIARMILQGQRIAGVLLALLTLALLVRRWRAASAPQRRDVAPVLWTGSAALAALALSVFNDALGEPLGPAPAWALAIVFAAIPVAVLSVLLQRRLARGAVAGLVVELGERRTGADLARALRRALGDPSLELAYWLPARGRYADLAGRPVELPGPDAERAATVVRRHGEPVAALVHDPALRENAELVDSVCAAAALTLENERLQADLRARLAELDASRVRLVAATEAERRRLERDLHDGAQQRLVSLAMTLGLAQARAERDPAGVAPVLAEARATLTVALEELRELSHGIHPAILSERGLGAALQDLAWRAALPVRVSVTLAGRLPAPVEAAAWFAASEAVANATKHAHATQLRLRAECAGTAIVLEVGDDGIGGADPARGSGLRGLGDRIEAVGGRLEVLSPPGGGTTLRAEIPCA